VKKSKSNAPKKKKVVRFEEDEQIEIAFYPSTQKIIALEGKSSPVL
jgi:hypothetical protein